MKKLLLLFSFLVHNVTLHAAASNSGGALESADPDLSEFIRIMCPSYLPGSIKCVEESTPDLKYCGGEERLVCFAVGHEDASVREQTLSYAKQEMNNAVWEGNASEDRLQAKISFIRKVRQKALTFFSLEDLEKESQMFIAAFFIRVLRRSSKDIIAEDILSTAVASQMSTGALVGEDIQPNLFERDFAMRYPYDEFYKNGYNAELVRRFGLKECSKETISQAYERFAQSGCIVGIEIDREGLQRYFEKRATAAS